MPRALSSPRCRRASGRGEPLPQHGVRQVRRPRVDTHEIPPGRQRPDRLPDDRSEPPPPPVPLDCPADGLAHGISHFHALALRRSRDVEDLDRRSVASAPRPPQLAKACASADASHPLAHADRRARPFRRRAASTARPAFVAMRCRKPCFLARRRLFGWNVLFILLSLPAPSYRGVLLPCPQAGHAIASADLPVACPGEGGARALAPCSDSLPHTTMRSLDHPLSSTPVGISVGNL